MKQTQLNQILTHLAIHHYITTYQAFLLYGITRISQYIMMLRRKGLMINSVWQGNHEYVRYELGEQAICMEDLLKRKKRQKKPLIAQ